MNEIIHLDISEHFIGPRNAEAQDIIQIVPLLDGGCLVALRSIGVVRCRQTVEEITKQIMEVTK